MCTLKLNQQHTSPNTSMASTSRRAPPPPHRSRSWQDLPPELTELILSRLGAIDLLLTARKVCQTWRRIGSDPNLYRVVDLWYTGDPGKVNYNVQYIAGKAVELSCGQLEQFCISYFADDHLLAYVLRRSSQLRCLHLASCKDITAEGLLEVVYNLPLLDELHLYCVDISKYAIRAIGHCCPQLKTFRLNYKGNKELYFGFDENALAIAENMPGLRHLQLFGNRITRNALLAILKNCPHLESLDIRQCFQVGNLGPALVRWLSRRMKYLRLPYDSTADSALNDIYALYSSDDDDDDVDDDPYELSDIDIAPDDYGNHSDDDYDYYNDDYDYNENSGGSDADPDLH